MDAAFAEYLRRWNPDAARYRASVRVLTHVLGGDLALRLIRDKHPSEPEHITEYRRCNMRLFTKSYFDKIFTTFSSKIRNANDYSLTFLSEEKDPLSPQNAVGRGAASLQTYCLHNYPDYDDIQKWLFSDGLFALLTEPNGVAAVLPVDYSLDGESFLRPRAVIYEAARVVTFDASSCVVYTGPLSLRHTHYDYRRSHSDNLGVEYVKSSADGEEEYLYMDKSVVGRIVREKNEYRYYELLRHDFGEIPAFEIGGNSRGINTNEKVSVIDGAVDYWDEIFAMESDLQGALKQHVYPEKFVYIQEDCPSCVGTGKNKHGMACGECRGTGAMIGNTYATHIVRPPKSDEGTTIPNPPIGYVAKDFSSISILSEQIQRLARQGYAAINFEFLALTPAEQSGIAKMYDRQEMNASVAKIAEHLVGRMLKNTIWYIVLYRYKFGNSYTENMLNALMPSITSPKSFDIFPSEYIVAEIKSQRDAGIDEAIVMETEREYYKKRFAGNVEAERRYELSRLADPLPGYSTVEKQALKTAGGCTETDFVLSVNMARFISEAERADKFFWSDATDDEARVKALRERAAAYAAAIAKERAAAITGTMI